MPRVKSPNSKSPKPPKSPNLFSQLSSFLQTHSRKFLGIIGISLTAGALLGLATTNHQVLGTSTSSPTTHNIPPVTQNPPSSQQEKINSQISYWEEVIASQPTYRDAYIQLAGLHYQLGNQVQVQSLLNQARLIDPNWEHLDEVTQKLSQ